MYTIYSIWRPGGCILVVGLQWTKLQKVIGHFIYSVHCGLCTSDAERATRVHASNVPHVWALFRWCHFRLTSVRVYRVSIWLTAQFLFKSIDITAILPWLRNSGKFRWFRSETKFILPFLPFYNSSSRFSSWSFSFWKILVGYANRSIYCFLSLFLAFTALYLKLNTTQCREILTQSLLREE